MAVENGQKHRATGRQYRALLAVSEAIISHRDLNALFQHLAERLRDVVQFDGLALILHDAASERTHLHILTGESLPVVRFPPLADKESPLAMVLQNQEPLVVSDEQVQMAKWPRHVERLMALGVRSTCYLPLTTARCRAGVLAFGSKQIGAFDAADVGFLQQVANQVAVAVENALTFAEIEAFKNKLHREKVYLEEETRTALHLREMVGESHALQEVLKKIDTVAATDATVLVLGETGTGKELVARALHDRSARRERTFVKLNCAAIPTGLLESELFGHEKGAFTSAFAQRIGRFEVAHGGTLFLDEVGDIPLELQPKLLRVLQEQAFERVGGTQTINVDVRLVAATNRDLATMIVENRFRSDLYYRLNVFPIALPPLRERPDDIPPLVRHFTQLFAQRLGRRIDIIPAADMEVLIRYPWPGNVRELQNVIERAVILSNDRSLHVALSDMQPATRQAALPTTTIVTLADAERQHILAVLEETRWVVSGPKGAAACLGVKRSTLQRKMKRLGIFRPR
jgi:formate hydrogenlyase transcriptional activator